MDFICNKISCKRNGEPFANKYSLDKHERNCSLEVGPSICSGKRKRAASVDLNDERKSRADFSTPFNGSCVCGSIFRDKFNYARHALICPFIVPCTSELEKLNHKVLKIPSDQDLCNLKQSLQILSPGDQARVCLSSGICIPGFFPVLCNSNRGLLSSTWNEFGVTGDVGLKTLNDIVEDFPITFEEAFVIIMQNGKKVFIPTTVLTPPVEARESIHVHLETKFDAGFITISNVQHTPVRHSYSWI